jgi:hypothetical protein
MQLVNKKGDAATTETPYVVLAIVLLVLGISIFFVLKSAFWNDASMLEKVCYFSNNIKSGGAAFAFFPSMCSLEVIPEGEPMTKKEFASLIRRAWWMYLQGEEDLGNVGDEVFPVYQFTPSEDILLKDYFEYILEYNSNSPTKKASDISKTDYAYLERNTKDNSLCFDKISDDTSIQNFYLKKGNTYYIMFYDNQAPHNNDWGDKILISSDPDFDAGLWKSYLVTGATGILLSGGGTLSFVAAASGASIGISLSDAQSSTCLTYAFLGGNPNLEEE